MPTLTRVLGGLAAGAAAGAAGTTALNTVTYVDVVLRARGSSSTPQDTVEALADTAGVDIPGEGDERDNRVAGLGPLMGILTGVGVGAVAGALHAAGLKVPYPLAAIGTGLAAMIGADAPMAALGVSDPKTWAPADWAADAIPHLAYGAVTSGTLLAILGEPG